MNICMIVHAYYLKDARVLRYAESLVREGVTVDVLCLREGDEAIFEQHGGVSIHRVNVARRRGGVLSYLLEYLDAFIRFFWRLNKLYFSGQRYDVVHVHNFPNFLIFTAIIQKLLGSRLLLDVHDPMPELFRSKFRINEKHLVIRLLYIEERLSAAFADFVIVANHAFENLLAARSCAAEKIAVIMNGPDEKFWVDDSIQSEVRNNSKPFEVLYIGTLAERYGIEIALQAIAKIKHEHRIDNIRLSIIPKIKNEGDYVDRLFQFIRELGLENCSRILEPVPYHKMPDVIRAADVSVYTPLPDVHMDIGLSLKIPEVIAVGRPLVASRLSVLQRYFGEDALYMFEPGNVEECAERLLEVYHHPQDVEKRIKLSQEALKSFSWGKQKEVYLKIIASITDDKRIATL
jgi:glycosyltransferase involved in cell wall biosynthesis